MNGKACAAGAFMILSNGGTNQNQLRSLVGRILAEALTRRTNGNDKEESSEPSDRNA